MTYNIQFGMKGDNLLSNLLSHICIHGIMLFLPKFISTNLAVILTKHRSKYLTKILNKIISENPDILCLNEVLMGLHSETIEKVLGNAGYKTFIWGPSLHHKDPIDISTVIITKFVAKKIKNNISQKPKIGGGGGSASMFIKNLDLIVLALHMSSLDKELRKKQLKDVYDFVKKYRRHKILILGDLNQDLPGLKNEFPKLFANFGFNLGKLNPTCPYYYVPNIKPKRLDHILFMTKDFRLKKEKLLKLISDHKAVINLLEAY